MAAHRPIATLCYHFAPIAHAPAAPSDYCVVTTEVSKPRKQRQNRRIPDVCNTLGIRCIDTFTMLKELQFRTDWNRIR